MINGKYVHTFLAMSLTLFFALSGCSEVEQSSADGMNPVQHAPMQEGVNSDFWEQSISVHQDLPAFVIQLYGDQDVYTELSIVNSSTGMVVYQEHYDWDGACINKERFSIEMIDMDFDGYQDVRIDSGFGGNWKKGYIYIMWSPDTASFVGDIYGLDGLGVPQFHAEEKLVTSMQRASAVDHWFYTHQYIDGHLVTIEEVSVNCVHNYYFDDTAIEQLAAVEPLYDAENTSFYHFMVMQLDFDSSEMVIIENKFGLYDVDGMGKRDLIVEYEYDSEVGLQLREILGGVDLLPNQLRTKRL